MITIHGSGLEMFDLEKCVHFLAPLLKAEELCLGDFVEEKLGLRRSLANRLANREVSRYGSYPLLGSVEGSSLMAVAGFTEENVVGWIGIETGTVDRESCYASSYERLDLLLSRVYFGQQKHAARMIIRKEAEQLSSPATVRKDYIRRYGIWCPTDLRSHLPDLMFER